MERVLIPKTINKQDPFVFLSAMQKCIRRGLERQAMEFAVELVHTSKAFCSMVGNRLEIISHEDIDCLAQPHIVPFVRAASQQAREFWTREKPGKARLPIGNAIRIMCRAKKSREGDHFNGAIGGAAQFGGFIPEVPDWAHDHHTKVGRKLGRGIDHFRAVSAQLIPQAEPDIYEDEFYHWQKVRFSETVGLFDEESE
jgi:replication-associated recombination protein RarA